MTTADVKTVLRVSSPEFKHESLIPRKYTCEGAGINPPIVIEGIPDETKSLVLIIEDPDAPGKVFDHWVVWNIPPQVPIQENSIPGMVAKNSLEKNNYTGPCPPSGTHRYFFKVYALDTLLEVNDSADKKAILQAMQNHVHAYGEFIGLYKKQKS